MENLEEILPISANVKEYLTEILLIFKNFN